MKLVSVTEMVAIEREANADGLTYDQMMENAGNGLAQVVLDEYSDQEEASALGLVGSGNNGGDTLVALSYLVEKGWKAIAYLVRPRPDGDSLVDRLAMAGGQIFHLSDDPDFEIISDLLRNHTVLMDGILGTGIHLPLKAELAQVMGFILKSLADLDNPPYVVAVDCPSGMDCDSGESALECIPADITVTMAAIKQGLLKFPAYNLAGDIHLVDIGLPDGGQGLAAWKAVKCIVPEADWVRKLLPPRPLDAHKGTFGTALVVAGSTNYTGAAILSGRAAYLIGAGLVTMAVPEPLHSALAGHFPEATWLLLPEEAGVIDASAVDIVIENLYRTTALLIGPGLGLEETTANFLVNLFPLYQTTSVTNPESIPANWKEASDRDNHPFPLVIDADGLKLLTRLNDWPSKLPARTVLTPHPGEMAVLIDQTAKEIQANRISLAKHYSKKWGHVVVLKGAFTVIASPEGETAVIPVATSALARAGTGDVLAGLIVGLRAQGVDAFHAATTGAWIHAYAGLYASTLIGNTASVLAGDILQGVIEVLNDLQ